MLSDTCQDVPDDTVETHVHSAGFRVTRADNEHHVALTAQRRSSFGKSAVAG